MAYTTINKSSDFFNTKLYTGNGSTQTITGVGFQPDFTWIKQRNGATAHFLFDVLRGPLYRLQSNSSNTSVSAADTLTSWNSDGFALGGENDTGGSGRTFASWNWKGNGAGSANTAGSINSTVSANTTSGFSIVKYTGYGGNSTIGHGLNSPVKAIFTKALNASDSWTCGFQGMPDAWSDYLRLDTNTVFGTNTDIWQNTAPTNSLFYVGHGDTNTAGRDYIAYCFADVQGYSKVSSSYTGNGNADGSFVYTGFKPAFLLIKNTTTGSTDWCLRDNKRSPFNVTQHTLFPNTNDSESSGGTSYDIDFLSNGFKIRNTSSRFNTSGNTYIYMAFAAAPLVGTNNIPANAF